ncbi:MAG TPA: CopG family transcriptional regulator [Baekduia sp.]|nr:CopG family transcriptional regulator [Baekduia sp.]
MRRTQIYLDGEQDRLLGIRAKALGTTKSAVIRDAIDAFLGREPAGGSDLQRLRAAVAGAAGIAPSLPPGGEYVEELRAADLERQRTLDRRRVA